MQIRLYKQINEEGHGREWIMEQIRAMKSQQRGGKSPITPMKKRILKIKTLDADAQAKLAAELDEVLKRYDL